MKVPQCCYSLFYEECRLRHFSEPEHDLQAHCSVVEKESWLLPVKWSNTFSHTTMMSITLPVILSRPVQILSTTSSCRASTASISYYPTGQRSYGVGLHMTCLLPSQTLGWALSCLLVRNHSLEWRDRQLPQFPTALRIFSANVGSILTVRNRFRTSYLLLMPTNISVKVLKSFAISVQTTEAASELWRPLNGSGTRTIIVVSLHCSRKRTVSNTTPQQVSSKIKKVRYGALRETFIAGSHQAVCTGNGRESRTEDSGRNFFKTFPRLFTYCPCQLQLTVKKRFDLTVSIILGNWFTSRIHLC